MSKNRKYSAKIEKDGSSWKVQILRQVTSKKTIASKEQEGFASEAEAQEWADQQLLEFTNTQSTSNQRHGDQRKINEQERQQRSERRAEKTKLAKEQKAEMENIEEPYEDS